MDEIKYDICVIGSGPGGFAATMRGFDFGKSRQPMSAVQEIDRDALQTVLQCILADFGYADVPGGGCAPRTGIMKRDQVSQIAQSVIETLKERGVI